APAPPATWPAPAARPSPPASSTSRRSTSNTASPISNIFAIFPAPGGLLPKVIASYNAGPAPVVAWNARYDQSDPLLYIESLPYWETRGYVPIILRNYWIYKEEAGKPGPSRAALAQGLWPGFPGMSGASAVRLKADETKLAHMSDE